MIAHLTGENGDGKTTIVEALKYSAAGSVKELEQSHKVLDMNSNMNKYLKIPKPILEYVIFCHQEDTLWPFDEGKALKEKFDDIFQSAEFVNDDSLCAWASGTFFLSHWLSNLTLNSKIKRNWKTKPKKRKMQLLNTSPAIIQQPFAIQFQGQNGLKFQPSSNKNM